MNKNEKNILNQDVPAADADSLLNSLEEIRNSSDQMTLLEYTRENTSSYEEAFPNLCKDPKVREMFNEKKLKEVFEQSDISNLFNGAEYSGIADLVKDLPGETTSEKIYNLIKSHKNMTGKSIFTKDNENEKEKWLEILSEKIDGINEKLEKAINTPKSVTGTNIIELTSNNLLVIDLNRLNELTDKVLSNALEQANAIGLNNICLFGLTNLMLYKGIVATYDRGHKIDLSSIKGDNKKLIALRILQDRRYKFCVLGSLIVMAGINSLFFSNKFLNKNLYSVNSNISSNDNGTSSNIVNKSIIFLFTKFKNLHAINKFLIIIMLLPVIFYMSYMYLGLIFSYYRLFMIDNYFYINLLLILLISLSILYEIITIYIINKFSLTNEKPNIHKYVPSYIKNKILLLYEISQFEGSDKLIIINILIKNILFLILLLTIEILITIYFY